MNDPARDAASALAVQITAHIFPFMRATPENAEVLRLAVQRALDECWPGIWLADFAYCPQRGRWPASIAAVVVAREPNKMVSFDDSGAPLFETDAEQDCRMFGGRGR